MQPFFSELEPPETDRALATLRVGTDNGSVRTGRLSGSVQLRDHADEYRRTSATGC